MRRRVEEVRAEAVRWVPVVLPDEVRTLAGALGRLRAGCEGGAATGVGAIPHTLQ